MKTLNVYSAKNQGSYKRGELIRVIRTENIDEYFGFKNVDLSTITNDGTNRVIIKEVK